MNKGCHSVGSLAYMSESAHKSRLSSLTPLCAARHPSYKAVAWLKKVWQSFPWVGFATSMKMPPCPGWLKTTGLYQMILHCSMHLAESYLSPSYLDFFFGVSTRTSRWQWLRPWLCRRFWTLSISRFIFIQIEICQDDSNSKGIQRIQDKPLRYVSKTCNTAQHDNYKVQNKMWV